MRLRPIVESKLIDTTFNNRKGKGTLAAVENVISDIYEVSNGYTKDCYIIKFDLKGYFPNMIQDIAYKRMMKIVDEYSGDDKEDIEYIIRLSCYCNPQFNSYRKAPIYAWNDIADYKSLFKKPFGIGGAIGFLFWQIMSNLYVSDVVHWIHDEVCPHITQFVDDYVLITDQKEYILSMMPKIREKFAEIGVTVNPKKFYCQPYQHGLEFLGFHIKPYRIHLNKRIVDRSLKCRFNKNPNKALCQVGSYNGLYTMGQNYKNQRKFMKYVERNVRLFSYYKSIKDKPHDRRRTHNRSA